MRISAVGIAAAGAFALALGNLGRIPAGVLAGRNAPVTALDAVTLLVWAVLIIGVASGRLRLIVDDVVSAAAAFVVVAAISSAFAFRRYGLGVGSGFEVLAFLARWVLYFGWYPFVAWCLSNDESRRAVQYVDWALLFIAGFGVIQSLLLPEFGQMVQFADAPEWEFQGRRLVSTLLDPNFAGAAVILALIPRLASVAEDEPPQSGLLVVLAAALVMTASRSSILALGVGIGVIIFARGFRKRLAKTLVVGVLLLAPFVPLIASFASSMNKFQVDASAAQRLVTWKRAGTLFLEQPLLGIGFNATRQAQLAHGWTFIGGADTAFDGGLLFVMVMTGVVGVTLYLIMLWRVLRASQRAWRDDNLSSEDRATATGAAACTVAIIVHSLFSNSLLLPLVMVVLWIRYGRLAHFAAARRSRLKFIAALPLVLAATSCDPCSGVSSCASGYFVRLEGKIVDYVTSAPVRDARMQVTFTGAEGTSHVESTTDADGLWSVTAPTSCCDHVSAEVIVSAPGQPSYVVPAFPVRTLKTGGDAELVGRWLNRPFVAYGIHLVHDVGDTRISLASAGIRFTQTGGLGANPLQQDQYTDGNGIGQFHFIATRVGSVIGTLEVTHPSLPHPWKVEGVTIPVGYRYELVTVSNLVLVAQQLITPRAPE